MILRSLVFLGWCFFFVITAVYGQPDYAPGQLLIKINQTSASMRLAPGQGSLIDRLRSFDGIDTITVLSKFVDSDNLKGRITGARDHWVYASVDNNVSLVALSERLLANPAISAVEPNYYVESMAMPNDAATSGQNYLWETSLRYLLGFPAKRTVTVAIIDTGIDYNHEDLQGVFVINSEESINGEDDDGNGFADDVSGYNFTNTIQSSGAPDAYDDNGHGTHIAGLIAANANNEVGIVGLNSKIKILNLKFLDSYGRGTQLDAAWAIRYAVDQGAEVINCSWGYYRKNGVLADAIAYALDRGVIIVAAGGNSGVELPIYPAGFEGVIGVGSVDLSTQKSYFSNTGSHIDFMAFGNRILSLEPGNGYGIRSGTSQSTAIMTGIVARLLSAEIESSQISQSLKLGAAYSQKQSIGGFGIVDISKIATSLDMTISNDIPAPQLASQADLIVRDILNFPNPIGQAGTTFGFNSTKSGQAVVTIYNHFGRAIQTIDGPAIIGDNGLFWDGRDQTSQSLPPGSYFYTLNVDDGSQSVMGKGKIALRY